MKKRKQSFLEKLTGVVNVDDERFEDVDFEAEETTGEVETSTPTPDPVEEEKSQGNDWIEEDAEEGQLTVDVYQTDGEIVVQSMIAGVTPENLSISITREMVTIKGKREAPSDVGNDDYFHKELYWGSFSRSILLPHEVETEEAEAVEKYGLLVIKLPKIDKQKVQELKVKSI